MSLELPIVGTALVVAPHPDDETIAAWALMRRLRRAGTRVSVVVVSDGGASHPGSRAWPRDRLVRERRRETRRAMRAIGILPPAIVFLGLPDGALAADPRRLRAAICRSVRRQRSCALVVGPIASDAHPDHRAVAEALAASRPRVRRHLGYQVWPERAARGARRCSVRLDPLATAMKRQAIRGYRTQAGLVTDATGGFTITRGHLNAFARPCERFARPR